MKLAPTGVAAININWTTINTGLGIPKSNSISISKLSDKLRCSLRQKYSEVSLVIIDEISMVSNVRLYHIHFRLCEIFNVSLDVPFGGLAVLTVGDLYQLPPVRERKVFSLFKDEMLNFSHPWHHFDFFELTEVMRQQGDNTFINILNNVRSGNVTKEDLAILESRNIELEANIIPDTALYLFAENQLKDSLNKSKLDSLSSPMMRIHANDKNPVGVSASKIEMAAHRNQSSTGGLENLLELKRMLKICLLTMLTLITD